MLTVSWELHPALYYDVLISQPDMENNVPNMQQLKQDGSSPVTARIYLSVK